MSGKGARRRQGAWQAREVMEQCRRQGQTTTRGAAKRRGAERERGLAADWADGSRYSINECGGPMEHDGVATRMVLQLIEVTGVENEEMIAMRNC